ncbi:MAG: transcriptional regulator [Staphylothermus sp.]|nr:transcriptional regulator [Staphylothermus sp.]
MIYLLAKKKAFFMDMVSDLDITPGNLWSHLVKLQGEGYIEIKYV